MSEGTGAVRTVMSDAGGHYLAPSLAIGGYRVSASLEGFQTEIRVDVRWRGTPRCSRRLRLPNGPLWSSEQSFSTS